MKGRQGSLQKALDDLLLGFLLGQAEGQELGDLVAGDLADGCLMDEGGVQVVGVQLGHRQHPGVAGDQGVELLDRKSVV